MLTTTPHCMRLQSDQTKSIVNLPNKDGKTCLHVCASRPRNTPQLKLLLTKYMDFGEQQKQGDDIRKVVIEVDAKDQRGNTALMIAADHGAYEALKLLIDAGADRTKRNHDNKNAFDYIKRVVLQMRFFDYKGLHNGFITLDKMKVHHFVRSPISFNL